jgi:para-nitrobenzyl esterase
MGNLSKNTVYAWTPEDHKVSETTQSYFANFIKTGNPNAKDLPEWAPMKPGQGAQFMRLDVESGLQNGQHEERYLFLERQHDKK